MTEADPLRARLLDAVGKPLGPSGPMRAPDPVNLPMIRHWVDAFDDHDPVYLDEGRAARSRFGGLVAPPAMLQTWTMGRPRLEGIAERGGSPVVIDPNNPIKLLDAAGYVGTLATNSEFEFQRYLRPGEAVSITMEIESISPRKKTSLGLGYFLTWLTHYRVGDEEVGRQLFRIFKFDPNTIDLSKLGAAR